ncbi:MAG: DnaD domain protein [Peptoclostridium sp.]|uniref:DnaD domain protein n=1 Tax=Peptoclostridium sp. TaxID=1904860 RepID=UPI00139E1149|nr:DnaD domain protein [Peptoclostridium sp.]MZQ74748.1 DnaD domain protein [Peptoclostridium sp.]
MFYKEKSDVSFGQTPLDNIFIDIFMPMSNGTFVMVYILGYRYACQGGELESPPSNMMIARNLGIPLSDVLGAWSFWEERGLIKKHANSSADETDYSVEFMDLKKLYMEKIMPGTQKSKSERIGVDDLILLNENESIQSMFNFINDTISRELVPNEKRRILEIMEKYNMTCDVVKMAYTQAMSKKGIKNISYIESILRNWYDLKITNMQQLEEHIGRQGEKISLYSEVFKALGFARPPSAEEKKVMDSWTDSMHFDIELILKACSRSKNTSNPSIAYINGILRNWHEKGIKTVEDAELEIESRAKNQKSLVRHKSTDKPAANPYKTKFHFAEERSSRYTPEEFEKIVLESQKKRFNK